MLNGKKNILFVVPTMESGGVETGIVEIAKQNSETKDFNMFLLSYGGTLISKLKVYGVNIIELDVKSKNPFTILGNNKKIEKIIKEYKIDIVQAESRIPAWNCYRACKKLNIPLITTVQFNGLFQKKFGPFGMFSALKRLYNSIMFRSNIIICVSNYVYNYAMEYYKKYINSKNYIGDIKVIHRGIDLNLYSKDNVSVNRILSLQEKLKIPEDRAVITVPARFSKQKGQDYFLKTLKYLKSTNYVCLLVGDLKKRPKYVKYIKKLIYKYNLQNYVIIHDNINDIQALYYISTIVVSSSLKPESFGRISIEAQAMERIFVGTAIGGTLETVIDGKTGFLAPENNEILFAEIIDNVLNLSENEKAKITKEARKNVAENFSFKKCYDNLLEVYKSI